jgi:DNA-directed RNA polymerase subunit beta'
MTATPVVKVGDTVEKGKLLADTNYTKGGDLALGTNLNVAYTPFKGYNFEDGIVISENASKKLTSEHMHREGIKKERGTVLSKKRFLAETAGRVTKEQAAKLDDEGVVREGTRLVHGDIMIGALKEEAASRERQALAQFSKGKIKPVVARPRTWDKEYEGTVSQVVRHGKDTTIYVKTETPAGIGDKIVGRHGNKGIISMVLPDHEMPHTKDGESMDVLLNQSGVPTRINLGQALETAASKIAKKTGKTYVVNNFDPKNPDYTRGMLKELKDHGLSDQEELIDPQTRKSYGSVLAGKQYIMKLEHQAEKKMKNRFRGPYSVNRSPKGGGDSGGQQMDMFGLTALLAHGAKENIRESQTSRSDMNDDFWMSIQAGDPIPAPKIPFAYKKFEGLLRAAGVDVEKNGNELQLAPLTDSQVLKMSNGELKRPERRLEGNAKPAEGGLFDPEVTGTRWPNGEMGDKWSHIKLAKRVPNPVFEQPVRTLLGMTGKQFNSVMAGTTAHEGGTGPDAIVASLNKINTKKELDRLQTSAKALRGAKLDTANKKIRLLRALNEKKLNPKAAYTLGNVPVLPPTMRPISLLDSGDLNEDDTTGLYANVGQVNYQLKNLDPRQPIEDKHELHSSLYDGVKALMMTGMSQHGRHRSGIIDTISGAQKGSPKHGYFQKKIMGRRQDLSSRGVIIPEPSLSLDEVGLPAKAAREIFKPFVVRRLVHQGTPYLRAQEAVRENKPEAEKALELEMNERPVLLKRDPVLHKYGVQAFRARKVKGRAIKIHPLVTAGYNADFDGDTMSAFVPISQKAVREAKRMMPSKNLFSPSDGGITNVPTQEAVLGLHHLTKKGKRTTRRFKTPAEAASAASRGEIGVTDVVTVDNTKALTMPMVKTAAAKGGTRTTVGRLMVQAALPKSARSDAFLTRDDATLNKRKVKELLTRVADSDPDSFAKSADKLKDLGNYQSTGTSFGLKDLVSDNVPRDKILNSIKPAEKRILDNKKLTKKQRDEQLVSLYQGADKEIQKVTRARAEKSDNRMYDLVRSGARGNWNQYRQMTVAPMLAVDSRSKVIPTLIPKAYSEGLDVGSYWAAMHGARMGTISRVLGTALPGKEAKAITQSTINQVITSEDCGTTRGLRMGTKDGNVVDRVLVAPVTLGSRGGKEKGSIAAGTIVTPDVVDRLRNNKVKEVSVRTPYKCEAGHGMCSKCFGLNERGDFHEKGVNVGVLAAQAIGEPLAQMSMNAFHEGGVAGAKGSSAVNRFKRMENLTHFPKKLAGSATLALAGGKVTKLVKDQATGGHRVSVGDQEHYLPPRSAVRVKKGQTIKKGDALTMGPKNPHEMLPLTGLESVQRYLTEELSDAYDNREGIHRRNTEVFVRSLTNLGRVKDPGHRDDLLHGDPVPISEIRAFNRGLGSGKKPVQVEPYLRGTNLLPKEMQTDWMARMQHSGLKDTILTGAARGWKSNLHGTHPVPGMAYGKEFGKGTDDEPWSY